MLVVNTPGVLASAKSAQIVCCTKLLQANTAILLAELTILRRDNVQTISETIQTTSARNTAATVPTMQRVCARMLNFSPRLVAVPERHRLKFVRTSSQTRTCVTVRISVQLFGAPIDAPQHLQT